MLVVCPWHRHPSLLVKIEKVGSSRRVKEKWDLSQYHHRHRDRNVTDDELSASGVALYPALYPLSQTQYAVALVS